MKNGDKIRFNWIHGTYVEAIDEENCFCLFLPWSDQPICCKTSLVKLREFITFEELDMGDVFEIGTSYANGMFMKIEPTVNEFESIYSVAGNKFESMNCVVGELMYCVDMWSDFKPTFWRKNKIEPTEKVERYYKRGTV